MDLAYLAELPASEFIARRERVFAQMADNSALIVFTETVKRRNRDCDFLFRPDSYFWYLTGLAEPQAALLLLKKAGKNESVIFLRENDPTMEIWNGRRLGTKNAPAALNIDLAFDIADIARIFAEKTVDLAQCYYAKGVQEWGDSVVTSRFSELIDWQPMLDEMRLFKSEAEIALIQQACHISALAHIRAMKQTRPNRYELEIEGEVLHEFTRFGARSPSYLPIVAGGDNACVLHYEENNAVLHAGELLLLDAGAEFAYYAGDITRTFPISGKFSEPQRQIYELVLKAQKAALALLAPNNTIAQASEKVIEVLTEGLVELGILKGEVATLIEQKAYREFYMHGLGHWLGLDVHDVGEYGENKSRPLEVGMVLTVEPGLYIAREADVPEQFKGIGVRIEDDILITEYGNKNLTSGCPKEIADIEAIMAGN